MARKKKNFRKSRFCDPGMCDHCMYLGEGDFMCDLHEDDPDKVLVISDWEPTENFMQCKNAGGNNNGKVNDRP